MVTGIRGDGGQLGTGTPGNSSGRRVVGRTGRSELVHMCSFSISAPSTARRTESVGSEPVRRSNRGPLTLCAGHSADSVTASQQIPVAIHTGARHVPNSGQAPLQPPDTQPPRRQDHH